MNKEYCVVLFYSTSLAIRGEKVAKEAGFQVKLIPTPRHLSSDCGTALRLEVSDRDAVTKIFEELNLDFDRVSPL